MIIRVYNKYMNYHIIIHEFLKKTLRRKGLKEKKSSLPAPLQGERRVECKKNTQKSRIYAVKNRGSSW